MAEQEIAFEQALEELQTIVSALEAGNVGLDASLGLYERGVELVRLCNRRLDEAQQRVSLLHVDSDGGVQAQPFAEGDSQ